MTHQICVIQLVVNMFNGGHRNIIYCLKLLCITVSVVNGYGAIAHGGKDVVFLLFTSCCTVDLVFFYAFVYDKAFGIPDGLERVRRALTLELRQMRDAKFRRMIQKRLLSIPSVGLKVGDFHMMERESTPIFVDYVLRNIVNLLMTF